MVPSDPQTFSNLVSALFETKTIAPTYKKPHILYTIFIIGKENQGIGRYRIKNEVGLGEGSTKTLLNRLKDEDIIHVDGSRQRGHTLSPHGQRLFDKMVQVISFPHELPNKENEFVIGTFAYFTLLNPNHIIANYDRQTLAMRDEAIKIGGTGCSTLEYNGERWFFPDTDSYKVEIHIPPEYNVEKGTIMVIGGGNSQNRAILATFAAALLITKDF